MSEPCLHKRITGFMEACRLFLLPVDKYHWQSIAVLLANTPEDKMYHLRNKMNDFYAGWFTDGVGTSMYKSISLYLSPKGMPYYCGYSNHATLTWNLLNGLGQPHMDRAGWIHISEGRADIHAVPTSYQMTWLKANEHRGVFMRPYDGGDRKQPVRYEAAEKYDVMPTRDTNDWARLIRRIEAAQGATPNPFIAGFDNGSHRSRKPSDGDFMGTGLSKEEAFRIAYGGKPASFACRADLV